MAKSREKVQQLGFFDTEVPEPDHDKVQLWAYRHASEIFRVVHPELFGGGWRRNEILPWVPYAGDRKHLLERAEAFATTTPRPDPRVEGKVLEYVLCRHTGYGDKYQQIVGYADLVLKTQIPMISESDDHGGIGVAWREGPLVLIEAKVKLPTVGELMRQLQLYRTAFRGKLVVVSPDDAYADLLREQDVTFIKYEA